MNQNYMLRIYQTLFVTFLILFILLISFYPKHYVKGGLGGFIGPGETAYKEEYQCLGFKNIYYPENCADCSNVYQCYGLLYNEKCYIEKYMGSGNFYSLTPTKCR